jgi:hypothetical protein
MSIASLAVLPADPRDQEVRLLVDLVRLSRLTLLYAEAGADKSAVLRSTVLPLLRDAASGQTEAAVLFDSWYEAPLAALIAQMEEVVGASIPLARNVAPSSPRTLSALLESWEKNFGVTFIVILDRFEQYLSARSDSPATGEFEEEFVAAVNDRTLRTHFLLSLDEDAAPLLARLRERIPGLGDARVRLPRLSTVGAAAPSMRAARLPADQSSRPDERTVSPAPIFFGSPRRSAASEPLDAATEPDPKTPSAISTDVSVRPDDPASPLSGSRSEGQQPNRGETLAERLERMRAEYNVRSAVEIATSASGAHVSPAEQKDRPGLADASTASTETALPFANDDEVTAQRRDPAPFEVGTQDQHRSSRARGVAAGYKRFPVSRGASLGIALGILVLSYWVILASQYGGRAPDTSPAAADSVAPPPTGNATAAGDAGGSFAFSGDGKPLRSERDYFASDDWLGQKGTGSAPAHMAAASSQQAPGATPLAPHSNPHAQVPQIKRSPAASTAAPAHISSGSLLYIHVRNEAQRARAERMIQPLAKRGIRVTGIKLVRFGPSVPDLRYFRSAERDEAVKVALALRDIGIPAQHLHQVSGFERRATPRQFELWLPEARR